jgi:hypothetical protein
MDQNEVELKTPVTFTPPSKIVSKIAIRFLNFDYLTGGRINVLLKTDKNEIVDSRMLDFVGQDYANWGTETSYVTDWVISKLGYTNSAVTTESSN